MSQPAIVIDHLTKTFQVRKAGRGFRGSVKNFFTPSYDVVAAVKDLSFSVQPGERVAFVGPNGAGKSTTIKILSGILFPTSGTVSVLGFTPWKNRRKMAYRIGTVFGQRSQLWYHLPAEDTFSLLAHAYEVEQSVYKRRLSELVAAFEISGFMDKPVRQLSLGQRMRCEIVASLLHKPDVLFLDEPTVGLDVAAKAVIRDLIRTASQTENLTVLLTSHDTGDMERVCDRVIVIDHGTLVADRPVTDLRSAYIHRKVITLAMREAEIALPGPGLKIMEKSPHRLIVEVDTAARSVESVIQSAMRQTALPDITVEDPPMEEIIKAIYDRERARVA